MAGVPATVVCVRQVAEPIKGDGDGGCWNKREWLPSLVASSRHLGKIPVSSGANDEIDWIPVDEKISHPFSKGFSIPDADAGSEETQDLDCDINPTMVYHAVNPKHTTWTSLLPTIRSHFIERPLEIVSLQEWVNALKESADATLDVDLNPAIRLLDFYQSLANDSSHANPVFETSKAVDRSEQLKLLEAVKPEWMKRWLEQWDS
ncbi:MAG: hypothetical protein Q9178_005219 [Gyalolechia marmorata]